jgi:hypothetical protein
MNSFLPSGSPTWFETFMTYPSYKFALGFGVGNGWDVTLSGNYLPTVASTLLLKPLVGDKSSPEFNYTNVGISVRKAFLKDSGAVPGLSLGASYHFTTFHFDVNVNDWIPTVDLGSGDNMTTTGSLAFDSSSQVVTLDLHVSKHLSLFEPYFKLSGAYQNTTFTGDANLTATSTSSGTTSFKSTPSVNLSDFAFLTTVGFDVNLFLFHYNLNVMADLSRAKLNLSSFSLDDIHADAFTINTGLHWTF